MIPYLAAVLLILYCVFEFDIRGHRKNRAGWYWVIMVYLTLLSAFAYRMGGDGMEYFKEYSAYDLRSGLSWSTLTSFNGRMPGWVLLSVFCHAISSDYAFFKFVHAILLNVLFFRGMRVFKKWRFSCVLFYFVLMYFDFNFQILRQSLMVGLFLNTVPLFFRKQWGKYYFICLIGCLFHESMVIALLVPLARNIKLTRPFIRVFVVSCVALAVFGKYITDLFVFLFSSGAALSDKLAYYTPEAGGEGGLSFILNIILNLIIPSGFLLVFDKYHYHPKFAIFAILYSAFYVLGLFVPILYRINHYFILFFYELYIEIFAFLGLKLKRYCWGRVHFRPGIVFVCLCLVFLVFKSRMYLLPYGDTGYPSYTQYYPYASVITERTDPMREALFAACD